MRKELAFSILLCLFVSSCSKSDEKPITLTLQRRNITMHYDEQQNIGASSNSDKAITYLSSDELTAEVTEQGVVTAGIIGSSVITVSDGYNTEECGVVVTPKYDFFVEPYFGFGESMTKVKSKVTSGTMIEDGDMVMYRHSSGSSQYDYLYSFEYGKLHSIGLFFNVVSPYSANYPYYLFERYIYIGQEEGMYGFINRAEDVLIAFDPTDEFEGMYLTIFMEYDEGARSGANGFSEQAKSIIENYKSLKTY